MKIQRIDFEYRLCVCGNVGPVYTGDVCLSCAVKGGSSEAIRYRSMATEFPSSARNVKDRLRSSWGARIPAGGRSR